jgi:hypothetical protein
MRMKKINILFFGFLLISGAERVSAQVPASPEEMKTVLKTTFDEFDNSKDQQQKIQLSGKMGMIAAKWDREWITHYYVAYSKVVLSEESKLDDSKRDALLDEAGNELQKAVRLLGKENDETLVLGAFIANWRIAISPMSRYAQYGKVFSGNMRDAKTLNPDNPRIYYLQGMAWYGMPKFAGGGKEVALPYLSKADSLYTKENDLDITKPYWGKRATAFYLTQSKSKE